MGNYWLLQNDSSCAMQISSSWYDILGQQNIGTRGVVSFSDPVAKCKGCFCILKAPRTLEVMKEKLGLFCVPTKLNARFSMQNKLYLEYARRNLLCMEQKGICDVLGEMKVADRPPPIQMEGEHCDHDAEDHTYAAAAAAVQNQQKTKKRATRSFACQVLSFLMHLEHAKWPLAVKQNTGQ